MIIRFLSSFFSIYSFFLSFLSNVIVIMYLSFLLLFHPFVLPAGRSERKSAWSFWRRSRSSKYADSFFLYFLCACVGCTVFVQRPVRSRRTGFCPIASNWIHFCAGESIAFYRLDYNGSFPDRFSILFISRMGNRVELALYAIPIHSVRCLYKSPKGEKKKNRFKMTFRVFFSY